MADYYGDSEEGAQPHPGPDTGDGAREAPDPDESENQTALIPKALGGGKTFDVGDEIVLEIVGVHESEYEVKYASEKGGDSEEESEPESPNEPAPSRWDGMMG